MSGSKRPSTSSLRRFITSRPYVPVAELRRRFGLDEPDAMAHLQHNGTSAWIGLPEREATKLQDLWDRGELGVELSVEVHAPVVVGIYPMRIARYVTDGGNENGSGTSYPAGNGAVPRSGVNGNGSDDIPGHAPGGNGSGQRQPGRPARRFAPRSQPERGLRPMPGAPAYGTQRQPGGE